MSTINFMELVQSAKTDPVGLPEGYMRDPNGDPVPEIGWSALVEINTVDLRETKNGFPRIMISFYDPDALESVEQVMLFDNINFSASPAANRITLQKLGYLGCDDFVINGGPEAIVEFLSTIQAINVSCVAHDTGTADRIFPRYVWNDYGNGNIDYKELLESEVF
jgi:hypothetical protein